MTLTEAIALERDGRLDEAEAICRRAIGLERTNLQAHHLLGTILYRKGDFDKAIGVMRQAIALSPRAAQLRVNLAALLGKTGRHAEALEQLGVAIRIDPKVPELHNNLGLTLEALDRLGEASVAFTAAIRLRPNYPEAHCNLGNTLRKMGRVDAAQSHYQEAIRLRPDYVKAYDGLANVAVELGELDAAIASYRKMIQMNPDNAGVRSALLYTLHYHSDYDAAALYQEHREWGRRFCEPLLLQIPPYENDRTPERRLRIGYVSPDFREQTVPRFIGGALARHDHTQFEIYCYSDVAKADAMTVKLKQLADHWRDTAGQSDESLEKLIRDDRIDILIDLRGHASRNRMRLFARKPAPVQVNMVGYFNTTGLPTMDCRITDAHQDPPGVTEQWHTEQLARIPETCWCYSADDDAPDVAEPPALSKGHITFGSLNKFVKISKPCAAMWTEVLEAVPDSRLLLVVNATEPKKAVEKQLVRLGLPRERVDVVGKVGNRRAYLSRFGDIDIALDTFPFNGITTTCDALWMGVPVVSLAGGTSVSRSGKSILNGLGMPELVAESPEQFVQIAAELAADLSGLRAMRRGMRELMRDSRLMHRARFTSGLEAAYRDMWRRYVSG